MYLSGSDSHLTGCGLNVLAMNSLMENNGKMPKTPRKGHKDQDALGQGLNGVWTWPKGLQRVPLSQDQRSLKHLP